MDTVSRLAALEQQLHSQGESADLTLSLARVWRRLRDPTKALRYAHRSLELLSDSAPAWNTLGACLMDLERWQDAEGAFVEALRRQPDFPQAEQNLVLSLRQQTWQVQAAAQNGDWSLADQHGKRLLGLHRKRLAQVGSGIVTPFSALGFQLSADEQRNSAVAQAREFLQVNAISDRPPETRSPPAGRLRVGYLSADFRNNAAGHLLHQLFACHSTRKFEIYALSYGPEDGSEFRREIRATAEHFLELRDFSDQDAADLIRSLRLDLIVDLMGFAGNHRAGILARRPAPVQVSWLGYCMTTGAPWIDWFVADRFTVPQDLEHAFTEKLAFLPNSYQVYSGQAFARGSASRADHNLPESAIVLCCFNMPEKVDHSVWSSWMRILSALPDSVLWLLCADGKAFENYRNRAEQAGIHSNRIIPAPVQPKQQHLARLELADLFLDTTLCNAHTTASDALWAGVPVLTCPGELFAQRVAGSVCHAAGLPDLIVDSADEYESTAIRLGKNPGELRALKDKLNSARNHAPLFDVRRFAGDLESCFAKMVNSNADVRARTGKRKLPLVMVLGTWRSGTSALAGILHQLGVHFGDNFGQLRHPTPYPNTYESADLFPIIWASLQEPEMTALRPRHETEAELATWLQQHNDMALTAGYEVLGLKHPAASLLAESVRELWPSVLTVRTERRLQDCLHSMTKLGWDWPPDRALTGLKAQHSAALTFCDGPIFEYPQFLENPEETVDRLCEHLGLAPSRRQRVAAVKSIQPASP